MFHEHTQAAKKQLDVLENTQGWQPEQRNRRGMPTEIEELRAKQPLKVQRQDCLGSMLLPKAKKGLFFSFQEMGTGAEEKLACTGRSMRITYDLRIKLLARIKRTEEMDQDLGLALQAFRCLKMENSTSICIVYLV